jgi:hypothetical protein
MNNLKGGDEQIIRALKDLNIGEHMKTEENVMTDDEN